jgi:cell division septation protein DedD
MLLAADQQLAPAADNIKAMEQHIPIEQRRQGVKLAAQLGKKLVGGMASTSVSSPAVTLAGPKPTAAVPRVGAALAARPAAAPRAGGSGWRVQLGAFSSAANAQRAWTALRGKVGGLGSLQPHYVPAGAMTRLQAGPVATREAANGICASAKAAGSACFPVAP